MLVEGNLPAMRGYAWKIALIAIVFCYPVASACGRFVSYLGLRLQDEPSPADQLQMLRLGNLAFMGIGIFGALIAFVAGMESMRAEDTLERQLGRFSFIIVCIALVIYLIAFALGRLVNGIHLV